MGIRSTRAGAYQSRVLGMSETLDEPRPPMTRRDLFALIGAAAGGTVMYQAMTSLGHAAESEYRGPLVLDGANGSGGHIRLQHQ